MMGEQTTTTQARATAPAASPPGGLLQRACACGQHTPGGGECESCKKKRLQRSAAGAGPATAPPIVHAVLGTGGQPLDAATRSFMEPRFGRELSWVPTHTPQRSAELPIGAPGDRFEREAEAAATSALSGAPAKGAPRDFSHIRVHTGAQAAESARAVGARAYTVGSHIVFGAGAYAPQTTAGRHLLAHELAHTVQQGGSPAGVQRRLFVNPDQPTNLPGVTIRPADDPASSLTPAQRFADIGQQMQALCPDFEVDSSGEVRLRPASAGQTANDLATGSTPVGCCCLNVLSNAANDWTIEVSQLLGPRTFENTRQVVLSPTTTLVAFGGFTAGGTIGFQGLVPVAGHELCGHAAIMELGAHPPDQDRTTTDVHDPTVRIQNAIAAEQGVPASETRGLAASGVHRGESVSQITIGPFPFGSTSVSSLPAAARDRLRFAARFAVANNTWVDVIGHSDPVGSATAKQSVSDQRANNVRLSLRALGVPALITKQFSATTSFTNAQRFTRVVGVSDLQPPAPALQANHANWRRADIIMAGFPAGAQSPPPGTPTAVTPHTVNPAVPGLKASADPCTRLLVGRAYP